ncbi:MAG: Holliday junction branch migration protein RuvA [Candidatus Wildermuthbacteria bacterium]|nr:Holliday junction branch migration protein RuvA [Candidatus Wildermuthbacteria bacterium]
MISYLKGRVFVKNPDSLILVAGGVGYKVFAGPKTLALLQEGAEAELFCYLHLKREETMELYGVSSLAALSIFELIKGVSGIGPKAALALSSLGEPEEIRKAIEMGDESFFGNVHGVGSKKIQKVILELTGKLKTLKGDRKIEAKDKDLLDALQALGFPLQRAKSAVSRIPKEIQSPEHRMKEALKLARR